MTKHRSAVSALTLALLVFPGRATAQQASALAERPNIILFVADDLGWQDVALPFANHETPLNRRYRTPNLIRMAAEGMKFTNAYAAGPVCSPTRVSLITGRTPAETRITAALGKRDQEPSGQSPDLLPPLWNLNGLSPDTETPRAFTAPLLPKILRDAGYRTIHVGKGHWGAVGARGADPMELGFDVNIGGSGAGTPSSYHGRFNFSSSGSGPSWADPSLDVPGLESYHGTDTFLTEALTLEANKAIDQAVALGKPFFLHLAHFAPHTPLNTDDRFRGNYAALGLDPAETAYATLIEGLDKSLGDVLTHLEKRGLTGSTLIVFVSDNGASFESRNRPPNEYNAPLRSHKRSGYEGGLRVPLVIRWPGHIKSNATSDAPVITDDLFHTVLSLAAVRGRERYTTGMRGRDLSALLEGRTAADPDRVLYWHFPHRSVTGPFSAIRQGRWKLIYFYASRRYELYDLSKDLSEARNVIGENPTVSARLSRLLRDALTQAGAQFPLDASTKQEVEPPPLITG